MIVKMVCTFDYDAATNTYTPMGTPVIIQENYTKPSVTTEPLIHLQDNKYTLNDSAKELLGVSQGDRVDIRYNNVEGCVYPVISSVIGWGSGTGNVITKNGTVSYRGKANTVLSGYGNVFRLEHWKDSLFIMKDINSSNEVNNDIVVTESPKPEQDVHEKTTETIDDLLNELNLGEDSDTKTTEDDSNYEIKTMKFTF